MEKSSESVTFFQIVKSNTGKRYSVKIQCDDYELLDGLRNLFMDACTEMDVPVKENIWVVP